MIPIDIYPTSRPWWKMKWQAELTLPDAPSAVKAFTRHGAEIKALQLWNHYLNGRTSWSITSR